MTSKLFILKTLEFKDLPAMNQIANQLPMLRWDAPKLESTLAQTATLALGLFLPSDAINSQEAKTTEDQNTETLLGFCLCSRIMDEAELLIIIVAPSAQNQGCGENLLRHLLEKLQAERITRLFLEVRASNSIAQHLYQKLGFSCVHRRKNYYATDTASVYEDALILKLSLAENFY